MDKFEFSEDKVKELVLRWQPIKDSKEGHKLFEDICALVLPMLNRLVGMRGVTDFMEDEDVISMLYIKLWRALPLYDPSRLNKDGTPSKIYSFITNVVERRITSMKQKSALEFVPTISIDHKEYNESFAVRGWGKNQYLENNSSIGGFND